MKIVSAKSDSRRGMTLVELLVAATVLGLISLAAAGLARTVLQAHAMGDVRATLYRDGTAIMDRITGEIRRSTHVAIPNAAAPSRDVLAVSGRVNDDYDFYFGDPLFPRIDEDPSVELEIDLGPGLAGIDDDGDGSTDEGGLLGAGDDDEDGDEDEDPYNGLDDDGDGSVDEDSGTDRNGDLRAGIAGMDDNGDGQIDKNGLIGAGDDDDDWSTDEDGFNYVIYREDTGTLVEERHDDGVYGILSSQVSRFEAVWVAPDRIRITLDLTDEYGNVVTFSEVACPRNMYQKTGKRVR